MQELTPVSATARTAEFTLPPASYLTYSDTTHELCANARNLRADDAIAGDDAGRGRGNNPR